MPINLLLDNFHALAESPNGPQKLRELTLSLAFAGRLVSQSTDDEPASERVQKEPNTTHGRISKPLPLISTDEIPHELPRTWIWARLGEATNFGSAERADDIVDSTWVLDLEDIEKDTSRIVQKLRYKERQSQSDKFSFKVGDVLYGKLRPYLNKVVVADEPGVCTTEIIPIRPTSNLVPKYLMYALKRPEFLIYVNERSYGMKMPRLGTDDARMALLPIAPVNEQRRIVAKVDQLMALCDELEKRQEKKHQVSIQLNESALNKLTTSRTPEEFAGDWQRIKQNFDLLYDTPENVGKLKQAILQLAVQGKLVQQDPNDEPASVLLEKIKAEKESSLRGVRQRRTTKPARPAGGQSDISGERLLLPTKGRDRNDKNLLPPIGEDEVPYELPKGWVWARVGDAVRMVEYGTSEKSSSLRTGVPVVRMGDIQDGKVKLENLKLVPSSIDDLPRLYLKNNEILFNRTNSAELVGKTAIFKGEDDRYTFASYLIRLCFFEQHTSPDYVNLVMNAPSYRKTQIEPEVVQQCGQANFNGTKLKMSVIPLPPINEQKRIVQKVRDLMRVCDELETNLTHTQSAAERLVEACLASIVSDIGRRAVVNSVVVAG